MKTPVKIIIGIVIFIVLILIIKRRKAKKDVEKTVVSTKPTTSTSATKPTTSTPKNVIDNNTILKRGMTASRVQWLQNAYNSYRAAALNAGKPNNYPDPLTEDGKFGEKTEKAVFRIMGKKSVSWTEFKNRVDYLTNQLY